MSERKSADDAKQNVTMVAITLPLRIRTVLWKMSGHWRRRNGRKPQSPLNAVRKVKFHGAWTKLSHTWQAHVPDQVLKLSTSRPQPQS